jgi:hypothetical protein
MQRQGQDGGFLQSADGELEPRAAVEGLTHAQCATSGGTLTLLMACSASARFSSVILPIPTRQIMDLVDCTCSSSSVWYTHVFVRSVACPASPGEEESPVLTSRRRLCVRLTGRRCGGQRLG